MNLKTGIMHLQGVFSSLVLLPSLLALATHLLFCDVFQSQKAVIPGVFFASRVMSTLNLRCDQGPSDNSSLAPLIKGFNNPPSSKQLPPNLTIKQTSNNFTDDCTPRKLLLHVTNFIWLFTLLKAPTINRFSIKLQFPSPIMATSLKRGPPRTCLVKETFVGSGPIFPS